MERKMVSILDPWSLKPEIEINDPLNSKFSVHFEEGLNETDLLEKIGKIANAQVVLWYIGAYGLKEEGVKFYKSKINQIINGPNQASCWLLDFSAWGAFSNPRVKLTSTHSCAEKINQFNMEKLKCISASTLFQEMEKINEIEKVNFFKEYVVSRKDLLDISQDFKESHIKIGEIFCKNCPIFENIYEKDTAKCYSVVQYVEGLMIIDHIIKNGIEKKEDINIVFALPNDEAKYYKDEKNNFIQDAEIVIKNTFGERIKDRNINIFFLNFRYGNKLEDRPYNSGKKTLKNLTMNDVL
jgi:hypothetical protein